MKSIVIAGSKEHGYDLNTSFQWSRNDLRGQEQCIHAKHVGSFHQRMCMRYTTCALSNTPTLGFYNFCTTSMSHCVMHDDQCTTSSSLSLL